MPDRTDTPNRPSTGWEAAVPCRDALGRDRLAYVHLTEGNTVALRVPPGESMTLTGQQASELAQVVAAAARRVPARPLRTVAVTVDLSIVRTEHGWTAECDQCGTVTAPTPRYDDAEVAAADHLATHEHD